MKIEYLENVCDILDSQRVPITASERISGIYPYYGANGIQDYVNDYIFDDELVLLAEDGGNFGSKTKPIAYRVSGKCWVNNHAHVLKPKSCINVDYLCYALMFYDTTGIVNGATRQKLTQASMRKMKIPIVDMDEQLKIVNKLNYLVHLKENIDNQTKKYDDLVKSQVIEMFGDVLTNDKQWNISTLKNIADVGSSKRIYASDYVDYGVPFYRSKEIIELGNNQKPSIELFITKNKYDEIKNKYGVPQVGDILMTAVGTIGKMWIVNNNTPFYYKDGNLVYIRTKKLNTLFFEQLLEYVVDDYKEKSSAGSSYSALTIEKIKEMQIITPPIELQNQFADFIKHIDKLKFTLKQTLEKLENCYHSLMQEYFE